MSRTLYTIGYEGYNTLEFVAQLDKYRIRGVIDVRANPISRKKGFSKKALAFSLNLLRIHYYCDGRLGNPSEIRKSGEDTETMLKKYDKYIRSLEHHVFGNVSNWMRGLTNVCLLCYERDPMKCHRSVLADYLAELNPELTVVHLSGSAGATMDNVIKAMEAAKVTPTPCEGKPEQVGEENQQLHDEINLLTIYDNWRKQHDPVVLDWRKHSQFKWNITYKHNISEAAHYLNTDYRTIGTLYFSTEQLAEQFYAEHKDLIHRALGVQRTK